MNVRGEEQRGFDVNRTLKLARVPGSEMHHHLHLKRTAAPNQNRRSNYICIQCIPYTGSSCRVLKTYLMEEYMSHTSQQQYIPLTPRRLVSHFSHHSFPQVALRLHKVWLLQGTLRVLLWIHHFRGFTYWLYVFLFDGVGSNWRSFASLESLGSQPSSVTMIDGSSHASNHVFDG